MLRTLYLAGLSDSVSTKVPSKLSDNVSLFERATSFVLF